MGCVNHHSVQVQERRMKMVLVGLSGSGKTAIFEQLRHGAFVETKPTVGVNVDYTRQDLMLFDVAGRAPQLWNNYYEQCDVLVFVVDSTNREQLYDVRDQFVKLSSELQYSNVVILVMFNKQDLKHLDNKTLIEESGVYSSLDQDVVVQFCSAKDGTGIHEGIAKIMNLVRKQQRAVAQQQIQHPKRLSIAV